MTTGRRIWRVPAFLNWVHPALTPDIIAAAEHVLKVRLPAEYLDLLRIQNGGYTELVLPNSVQGEIWGIGAQYPTITDGSLKQRLTGHDDEVWMPLGSHLLIPFDGDGHWYMCFDYRAAGPHAEPQVALVDIECALERVVADSFAHFMSLLVRNRGPNPVFVVERISPEAVVEMLGKALGLRFEGPDNFNHGYPIWRAKLRDGPHADWVWIDPNEVPVAFRRNGRGVVETLDDTTTRFPEFSRTAAVITCFPGAAPRVFDTMRDASLSPTIIHWP